MKFLKQRKPRSNKESKNSKAKSQNYSSKFKIYSSLIQLFNKFSPILFFKIHGNSMKPIINQGDLLIVSRIVYIFDKPEQGDIVAVRDPRDGRVLIKRITGIESSKYFVEGDNKNMSTDSRYFGYLDRGSIIGKVIWSSRF